MKRYIGLNKMEKEIIESRANKVLSVLAYDSKRDTYVDAVNLANKFGFNVYESDNLPSTEDGAISVDGDQRDIVINSSRSIEFKRFVIVHELSHYLLHYKNDGMLFKHRENIKGKDLEENDADYMAACMLMPKESFVRVYNALKGKSERDIINNLFVIFRTPEESIRRRISEVC